MKKKLLYVVTAAALSTSLLVGCGSSSKTAETGSKPADSTSTANTTTKAYKDGTYKATYDFLDGHGWKPQLEIEIKDGKIAKVVYDSANAEGKLKTKDDAYNKLMKSKSNTSPAEYSPKLQDALVKSQDYTKVDTVTGATESSEEFKALAAAALAKAEKGDTSAAVLQMNATYTAKEKDLDKYGYKGELSITYKDGKIDKVTFEELDKDGKKKSDNIDYNTKMKAASKINAKEAYDKLIQGVISTGKVDTVTGATGIATKFKTLYEEALKMRK
ncbi:FMN-binding domain protein [Clostridium homopropionicum DSM 5847]|uniref:FMN-binding domain protein n=1 Tax=Clostridium homopropionicum DSM 5847 TaxID=1121318 RepID=A0A0L6Z626_9CLOT|nr:FMN-binding protein [Clostridium homopropionicum]KOA18420.1 FMN-binding domain protein [Clostridium homopropionicum DSM 5847]SFF67183.1 Major membrane immunogen, membrane-anchored lipoprotein [Clostridium homopropionicum]